MRQSSANSQEWDEVTHWGKSFKYTRNNNGPSTVPWGPLDVSNLISDKLPSRTTVWSHWERKVAATHSTRWILKNEPYTYRKKLDGLRLALFKTSLTNSLWHLPSKSIQRVNFRHLNGVHIFCQSWYNFFFRISKYNFFSSKIRVQFFFLKKTRTTPWLWNGRPLTKLLEFLC